MRSIEKIIRIYSQLTRELFVMYEEENQAKSDIFHWTESKETKRLMNVMEQLEAMANSDNLRLAEPSVKPSVADQVLAEENTRLKNANKEALGRIENLMNQINLKIES